MRRVAGALEAVELERHERSAGATWSTTSTSPPGRVTRGSSANASSVRRTWWSVRRLPTRSNSPRSGGRCVMSPSTSSKWKSRRLRLVDDPGVESEEGGDRSKRQPLIDIGARNLRGSFDFVHSTGGCFGLRLLHRVDRASSCFRSITRRTQRVEWLRARHFRRITDSGVFLAAVSADRSSRLRVCSGTRGDAVFHCRVREQEDRDMIRPYEVLG
jgi:hypothetical protein